ncbi:hypothetical protein PC111_g21437 [Phytophthora cactorum]|nr:hypothetical protein PC111_g21437 [Phytophthora cactorum]KAG2997748.1 hypothetical protein PC120_g21245 [Phytophthora cactorum]
MTTPTAGDLAFLGPAHISQLSEFQYVELAEFDNTTATVKLVSPMSEEEDEGKEPQMLLQAAQQSQHLEFIGTPPVLCSAYYFGFGVGLSIMHFRRALTTDEVATTESGVNMWNCSTKNSLSAPPRASNFGDLISALSAFYKYAKYFYNKDTRRFIGAAHNFVISYADGAPGDSVMARHHTHWVNIKFSKFRSWLVTNGLRSALRARREFSRNDEQLIALKETYPSWKTTASGAGSQRGSAADTTSRLS